MAPRKAWNKKRTLLALRSCAMLATGALLWVYPPHGGLSVWQLVPWTLYVATTLVYLVLPARWYIQHRFDFAFIGLELVLLGSIFAVYLGSESWLFYSLFLLAVLLSALARRLRWAIVMGFVVGIVHLVAQFEHAGEDPGVLLLQIAMLLITSGIVGYLSEELSEEEETTSLLDNALQIIGLLAGSLDAHTVYERLTEVISRLFRAGRVSVILTEPGSNIAHVPVAFDRGEPVEALTIDLQRYPEIQTALESKTPVIIGRVADSPSMESVRSKLPERARHAAILVTPILVGEEAHGVVFVRLEDSRHNFSDSEIRFCRVMADVAGQALERAEHYEEVAEAARRDPLTGLYNLRFFQRRLAEEVERADRTVTNLSFLMVDVDYLKHVNDTYGHMMGDQLLRQAANLLMEELRIIDTVARYGGEEFAILLPDTGSERAFVVAERIRGRIAGMRQEGMPESITVSIGTATYPEDALTATELLEKADQGLYASKNRGRNLCTRYSDIDAVETDSPRKDEPLHDPTTIEMIRDSLKGLEAGRDLLRHLDVIASLTAVMGAKDAAAMDQMRDVSTIARLFLAQLPIGERQRWTIHIGCLLRDVGKLAIDDKILEKRDFLTREEYEVVRRHPVVSAQIVQPLKGLEGIVTLVRHHHERWDGKGYPDGLEGEEIPYGARVVGLIDAFYAMVRRRPYGQRAHGLRYACDEIRRYAGSQFDPELAHRFLTAIETNRDLISNLVAEQAEPVEATEGLVSSLTERIPAAVH
jgi:diguanylate cyclase (GGDEF)-like protein